MALQKFTDEVAQCGKVTITKNGRTGQYTIDLDGVRFYSRSIPRGGFGNLASIQESFSERLLIDDEARQLYNALCDFFAPRLA